MADAAHRPPVTSADIARVFRDEHGRAVAVLIRALGDIDLAEDAVQDAFTVAVERWPRDGMPPSPAGWIITTARRRAVDRLRRESTRDDRQAQALLLTLPDDPREEGAVRDERLRLVFTCCHPALSREAQVALTLRLLGGLTTPEIARAFLVPEATMAQRIVRAKKKIRDTGIPYRVPRDADLPPRVTSVLSVVYLVFTEGHTATSGDELGRPDLAAEAIRLGRALVELMPDEPEARGLLALMLLSEARRPARTDAAGEPGAPRRPGPHPVGPGARRRRTRPRADAACGATPPGRSRSRPRSMRCTPTPRQPTSPTGLRSSRSMTSCLPSLPTDVVRLNRAVAVAEVDGPAAGSQLLDGLDLDGYSAFHVVRADLLAGWAARAEAATSRPACRAP